MILDGSNNLFHACHGLVAEKFKVDKTKTLLSVVIDVLGICFALNVNENIGGRSNKAYSNNGWQVSSCMSVWEVV